MLGAAPPEVQLFPSFQWDGKLWEFGPGMPSIGVLLPYGAPPPPPCACFPRGGHVGGGGLVGGGGSSRPGVGKDWNCGLDESVRLRTVRSFSIG